MALASYLQNFQRNTRRATRPPRVVTSVRQPTTRAPLSAGQQSARTLRYWYNHPNRNAPGTPAAAKPAAPKPAAAAAPAPAAPLAPLAAPAAPAGLPVDPSYEGTVAALRRQRDDQLLALGAQRTQGLQDFGYNQAPTGALNFDPSNPFSRAALLRKSYRESKEGTQTGMAARGQLYAGALQTAQAANDTSFNQGENSLQRALIAFLANNQGAANRAGSNYEMSVAQAMADRVMRAQQDLANNPPVVPDAPEAAPAGAAPAGAPAAAAGPKPKITQGVAGGWWGEWHTYPDGHRVFVRKMPVGA